MRSPFGREARKLTKKALWGTASRENGREGNTQRVGQSGVPKGGGLTLKGPQEAVGGWGAVLFRPRGPMATYSSKPTELLTTEWTQILKIDPDIGGTQDRAQPGTGDRWICPPALSTDPCPPWRAFCLLRV